MKIIDWNTFAEHGIDTEAPASFTTGVFDGVHRGHHQLINCLNSQQGTVPVLATFMTNPFLILRPDSYMGDISTLGQKLQLLEKAGVQIVILIDFSMKFSKLSGKDFFAYIMKHLNLNHLVLGKDHKLGRGGETTSMRAKNLLEPLGVVVDIVEPLIDSDLPVSSTRIRNSIKQGDLETAERLLGRKHELDLDDIRFNLNENSPFLRRNDIKQVIPFEGKYAVDLKNGNKAFAAKTYFAEDRIIFDKLPDFDAKNLTFNCLL
jgi:FAD synthase